MLMHSRCKDRATCLTLKHSSRGIFFMASMHGMSYRTAQFYFPNVDMYGNKNGPGKHMEVLYVDSSLSCSTIGKQDTPNTTLDSILFHDFHQRKSIFKRIVA